MKSESMRLGIVRGNVVLSLSDPGLTGTRFLIVEPVTAQALAAQDGTGGGKQLIVADHLGPAEGQMIAFVEGREGANLTGPGARRWMPTAVCWLIRWTTTHGAPRAKKRTRRLQESADASSRRVCR